MNKPMTFKVPMCILRWEALMSISQAATRPMQEKVVFVSPCGTKRIKLEGFELVRAVRTITNVM